MLLVAFAAATPAATQTPDPGQRTNVCLVDFPFPPTEANRVPARELPRLFAGKTFESIRRPDPAAVAPGPPPGGAPRSGRRDSTATPGPARGLGWTERVFSTEVRADGSIFSRCEERLTKAESFQPCRQRRGTETVQGPNEIGVWRIADGLYCRTFSQITSGAEGCSSVHRQDGRYLFKHVRGPIICGQGEIIFK